MNRPSWLMAIACCILAAAGCAKQVPSPDLRFETQQRVLLSFKGGEEVRGKIDKGNRVELREPGVVWTARVSDVEDDRIVLTDLVRVRDERGVAMQVARVEDARLRLSSPVPDKTLLRSEITGVNFIKLDPARTARNVTFWVYGAAVLAILLGER